jgi:hypothetical protein
MRRGEVVNVESAAIDLTNLTSGTHQRVRNDGKVGVGAGTNAAINSSYHRTSAHRQKRTTRHNDDCAMLLICRVVTVAALNMTNALPGIHRSSSTALTQRVHSQWRATTGRIDHDGPDLIWQQVANDLRAEIESGRLPPGAKLPSEPELSSVYGVAWVTIRSAIGSLKDEGLVTVTLGRGTYVATDGPGPVKV